MLEGKMSFLYIVMEFEDITYSELQDITMSYDEKPGVQAIGNTVVDRRPNSEHSCIGRYYEYKRHGTLSLLAAIDLRSA